MTFHFIPDQNLDETKFGITCKNPYDFILRKINRGHCILGCRNIDYTKNLENHLNQDSKWKEVFNHMVHLVLYHTEEQLAKWKMRRLVLKFLIGECSFRQVILTIPSVLDTL